MNKSEFRTDIRPADPRTLSVARAERRGDVFHAAASGRAHTGREDPYMKHGASIPPPITQREHASTPDGQHTHHGSMAVDLQRAEGIPDAELLDMTKRQGGATYHDLSGSLPQAGVYSGTFPAEQSVPLDRATPAHLSAYRNKHWESLANPQNNLGTWVAPDRQTGDPALYMDVSRRFATVSEAKGFAHDNAQDAVFDLGEFKEHDVQYGNPLPEGTPDSMRKQHHERGRQSVANQLMAAQANHMGPAPGQSPQSHATGINQQLRASEGNRGVAAGVERMVADDTLRSALVSASRRR